MNKIVNPKKYLYKSYKIKINIKGKPGKVR